MQLKIGTKLYMGFGACIVFLVLSGLGTWIYSSNVNDHYHSLNNNMRGAVELANVERGMWSLRFGIANYPGADENGRAKIMADEAKFYGDMQHALESFGSLGNLSGEEAQAVNTLKQTISNYMGSRPKWFELFNAGQLDDAKVWRAENTNKFGAQAVQELKDLIELQQAASEEGQLAVEENTRNARIAILSFVLFAALIAIGIGYLIIRSITRPLREAVTVADAVANGDLTQRIEVTSRDEVGLLLQALKDMNDSLSGIVGEVRDTTESINTASREIAQGNSDLSQRTEQQAANLEETASSMEELTSTVKQNTENAKHANQLAANASDIAVKGGKVVGDVVQTMASISTSSKKIVDIISVIEGIAFQTNILALNAAVEAARAGEQGRGFAVVAAEVRNLAQRSAAAAKEIKTLIDDSVNKVDAGSKQVDQAGETMNEIVTAVKRVTDIMAEIAAASNEQSTGIEEVNRAITQMDDVTQQNAALVEEAAAAAESMQGQSEVLMRAVSIFKLASEKGRTPAIVARSATKPGNAHAASKTLAPQKSARKLPKANVDRDGDWKEF